MAANRAIVLLAVLALTLPLPAQAPASGKGSRPKRDLAPETGVSALVRDAEVAIDKKDYPAAEERLLQSTAADPKDYRAWFDLGFVYSSTERKAQAIVAYRKSVELKPDAFEPNVNLGVLLAARGDAEAEKYLRAATTLKPVMSKPEQGQARAWIALAMFLETRDPGEALRSFQAASLLTPDDAEPHLRAAMILEKLGKDADAEKQFQTAAKLDPKSAPAQAGLANVYMRAKKLPEAEAGLRKFVALEPGSVNGHLQLGRVLRELGRAPEARAEFETASRLAPADPAVLRELAASFALEGNLPEAETRYRSLVQQQPDDPDLRYALGSVLLQEMQFPEAEQQFLAGLKLKPEFGEAYGDLALAAAENKHYELAIQALDARARYLPDVPGTYFLRATSYDNLRAYPQAAEFYHKFLEVSSGKFPDQEWQARHRLVAIEPKGGKKKK